MILNRLKHHRPGQRAQGIVEFALAAPIFFLIILGIFEFGRLFITYSSIYSAAREGARYGAAADNLCTGGVESQSKRAGLVAGAINITTNYDRGVGTAVFSNCTQAKLGDRIIVTASVPFDFITGFIPLPGGGPITLRSTAKRTIIRDVYFTWTLEPPNS